MLKNNICNRCEEVSCNITSLIDPKDILDVSAYVFDNRDQLIEIVNDVKDYNTDDCTVKKEFNYK